MLIINVKSLWDKHYLHERETIQQHRHVSLNGKSTQKSMTLFSIYGEVYFLIDLLNLPITNLLHHYDERGIPYNSRMGNLLTTKVWGGTIW